MNQTLPQRRLAKPARPRTRTSTARKSVRERRARVLFTRRTYQAFANHRRLAKDLGRALLYDLAWVRAKVTAHLNCPCLYCFGRITPRNFSLDHGLPVARGGTFSPDNILVVCRRCNETKGNLAEQEFRRLLACLADFDEIARIDVRRRLRAGGKALRAFMGRGRRRPTSR